MEKYYFITEDSTKIGVPSYLEAGLYEEFVEKESYIEQYTFPPLDLKFTPAWRREIFQENRVAMPEKLVLINKHKKIDFDFFKKDGGFIVSNEFKSIIDSVNHPQYVLSHLDIKTREGNINTKKEYWYIKFIERSPCIDFEQSEVKLLTKDFTIEQPRIDKYLNKLILNSNLFFHKELFYIDNAYLDSFLFCNQETADKITSAKIKTVKVQEISSFFDYLYDMLSMNKKTKMIIN